MRIACIPLAPGLEIDEPYWPTGIGMRPKPEVALAGQALAEVVAELARPAAAPWCRLVVMSSSRGPFGMCMWAVAIGPDLVLLPLAASPDVAVGYGHHRRDWMVLWRGGGVAQHQGTITGAGEALAAILPRVLARVMQGTPFAGQILACDQDTVRPERSGK